MIGKRFGGRPLPGGRNNLTGRLPPRQRRSLLAGGGAGAGDSTPGGAEDAILLETGTDGILLEDGSGVLLME